MSNTSHTEMHRQHTRWRADDDFWRDELAIWQGEVERAINEMPRLEKALRSHADALRKHATSIRLYEDEFTTHEHALSRYEQGEIPPGLVDLAQAHRFEKNHHHAQRNAHEMLKLQQHALMAKWNLLFTAILESSLESATGPCDVLCNSSRPGSSS